MQNDRPPALTKFLNKLWHFLISNVGAFVIGFSALIIGIYQYEVNRPILRYETETRSFISSKNENHFKVLVENREYDDLYQTVVILKNTGQQPLDGSDVSKIGHDPIRVVVPKKAELVHFTLDKAQTSEAVSVRLIPYEGDIILSFDYLNPTDQIAVTILHKKEVSGFGVTGSALGLMNISPALTDRQWFKLAVGFLLGLYLLTVILGLLDKKGYL